MTLSESDTDAGCRAGSWVVQECIKGTARVHAIKWYPPYYPHVLSQRENTAQLADIRGILQTPDSGPQLAFCSTIDVSMRLGCSGSTMNDLEHGFPLLRMIYFIMEAVTENFYSHRTKKESHKLAYLLFTLIRNIRQVNHNTLGTNFLCRFQML